MDYSLQKTPTHFKDSNKNRQPKPQTYVIFLCLGNKKLFLAASIILLWKLFLSTGVPLLLSSAVSREKM